MQATNERPQAPKSAPAPVPVPVPPTKDTPATEGNPAAAPTEDVVKDSPPNPANQTIVVEIQGECCCTIS